jgi:hypothetical protein
MTVLAIQYYKIVYTAQEQLYEPDDFNDHSTPGGEEWKILMAGRFQKAGITFCNQPTGGIPRLQVSLL